MPAGDNDSTYVRGLNGYVNNLVAITPDDDNELDEVTDGIVVDVTGAVKFTMNDAEDPITRTLTADVHYPYRVRQVFEEDTTATGIWGLYS